MSTFFPVTIFPEHRSFRLPIAKIKKIAAEIYTKEMVSANRKTNLIFCSDYIIRRLNRDFRNIDKVTDVLSFPFSDTDFLGEIYISTCRITIQARKFGYSFGDECLRLFVHGLLHLVGYDHNQTKDRVKMNEMENHYLRHSMY